MQFWLFLAPHDLPPQEMTAMKACAESIFYYFFERLMSCQDSYYNPGTCIVTLENYFLSFTSCNVDLHNIMYTSRDQH